MWGVLNFCGGIYLGRWVICCVYTFIYFCFEYFYSLSCAAFVALLQYLQPRSVWKLTWKHYCSVHELQKREAKAYELIAYELIALNFLRLARVGCICSAFRLVRFVKSVCSDWLLSVIGCCSRRILTYQGSLRKLVINLCYVPFQATGNAAEMGSSEKLPMPRLSVALHVKCLENFGKTSHLQRIHLSHTRPKTEGNLCFP